MRALSYVLVAVLVSACQTTPPAPVGSRLDTKGLEQDCGKAPLLTAEVNSSETNFLKWIKDFQAVLTDCSDRHGGLVNVLRRNEVLK